MNAQEFGALPPDGNPDALFSTEGLPLRPIKMTLEEFLESDLEGYEYIIVKSENICTPPGRFGFPTEPTEV